MVRTSGCGPEDGGSSPLHLTLGRPMKNMGSSKYHPVPYSERIVPSLVSWEFPRPSLVRRERDMAERTNEELADALKRWADDRHESRHEYPTDQGLTALLRQAARRLREQGERIEGSVYDAYPIGDVYVFKVRPPIEGCEGPATLILHPKEE